MRNIHVNSFANRQTADSRFSHFEGTNEELVQMVDKCFTMMRAGYRDGVILVPVSPAKFFSSVVSLSEGDELVGKYEPRREGETPRKYTGTLGEKQPAQSVEIVLYASSVLAENGDNELPPSSDNWEIISINASPTPDPKIPINPNVLMHNHFGSDGGTSTGMSDSEFVALLREGFDYWKDKAMCI